MRGGERDIWFELIRKFALRYEGWSADAKKAFAARDIGALERLAHGLTGVSANMGADLVAASARELENAARRGDTRSMRPLLDRVTRQLDALVAAIGEFKDPDV